MTPYSDVNAMMSALLGGIREALSGKLMGFYLYGSLVWGGFDHGLSDIDTLAAVSDPVTGEELDRLRAMHDRVAAEHPAWQDRIEVQYQSLAGLRTFRNTESPMAVISPGEPLHIVPAGREWLLNWYFVRTYGVTLFGPPPEAIIGPIEKREFLSGVREHALEWRRYITNTQDSRAYQGYAMLTLCRALYTLTHGEQVSKLQAAQWVRQAFPEVARQVALALRWREDCHDKSVDPAETYPIALQFVLGMIEKIESTEIFLE